MNSMSVPVVSFVILKLKVSYRSVETNYACFQKEVIIWTDFALWRFAIRSSDRKHLSTFVDRK